MRDLLLILLLLLIMSLNLFDLYSDLLHGTSTWHISVEALLVIATAAAAISLIRKLNAQAKSLASTKKQLLEANQNFSNLSAEMVTARHNYSASIHQQFNQWQLTKSEQEIALLMLKGLNFKEISTVRETKEKTVRQQASNIYSKANVEGRHEFSAWFFEDFLN
ncbi:LuxR C-terminal-related transcriptional regulator [Thalassotalea sp. G2M2-11]|uniref:helix-turn-helix transcriptional regulator n=1 Tax=Thalassotalea sp. G2M2-11 TaxID=2787627 RepID=UPI0019D04DD7|nr:LuxR C-terminal-related transcriptional regulator [Thalassotalea sp. G2M2-11]